MSLKKEILAKGHDVVMDWLQPQKHEETCSDLLYSKTRNSWRVIAVRLVCKEKPKKCSNGKDIVCITKCCPKSKIIDIRKGKCIKPVTTPMNVQIYSSKAFECNGLLPNKRIR